MTGTRSIFPVDQTGDDERLYFDMIDRAIQAGKDETISNGKPAHAIYLIYKFLRAAQRSIRIRTGRLSRIIDGNLLAYADPTLAKAAIGFLQKEGAKLSIVVVKNPDIDDGESIEDHPLIARILAADIEGTLAVSLGNPDDLEDFKYHFMVMDGLAMRIETSAEPDKAYVNFGDREFGELLSKTFDSYEIRGTPLIPAPAA